jgi:hypothetical protein
VSEPSTSELVINGVAAFGALAVAILAIRGDWVRSVLAPPKLTINNGQRLMYYYLKVVNQRPWLHLPRIVESYSSRLGDAALPPVSSNKVGCSFAVRLGTCQGSSRNNYYHKGANSRLWLRE